MVPGGARSYKVVLGGIRWYQVVPCQVGPGCFEMVPGVRMMIRVVIRMMIRVVIMGNYIFLAGTPFPQLLVDLLNFCSTSRISFSRIVSKCSVFSILSILKCSVVSGGEIDRFPSNHIINIFHQLNLDRIMLAFEMPACLSPSTHKSRGIQRCISHYEKALKLQNHSRIFVIWDPVVE